MSTSLPSREIYVVDVPEPLDPSAVFYYNFFVPAEGKSETGGIPAKYLKRSAGELGADFIDYASTKIPRFTVLRWTLPRITKAQSSEMEQRHRNNERVEASGLISQNLKKIITENDLSSFDYFSILLDDPDIDERIFSHVSSSLIQQLHDDGDDNDTSIYKTAVRAGARLPPHVDSEFLKSGFNQLKKAAGVQFFDQAGQVLANDRLSDLKSVNMLAQVNSKLVHRMLMKSVNDPYSPYSDELQSLLETSSRLTSYVKQKAINGLDENDFRAIIPYIDVHAGIKENTQHLTTAKLVGFIIDKLEHLPNGTTKEHPPIIIENPRIHVFADLRVKYGSTYTYSIRSVALFTMPAVEEETDDIASISFLVSSRPSSRVMVTCIEEVAPPPPSDINFLWDYGPGKLMIHWAFPPNSQRDIKEFQIFRRESINDPFELIKVYRFNDAIVQNEQTVHYAEEGIDEQLIERLSSPVTYHVDDDFKKNSKFIYTVCCVDAHGMTSNFGAQYQISFDVFKNKIQKKLISHTGAPKAYPNLYLESDLMQDTIRVGGPHSKRLKVYFNPEFYTLVDNKNREKSVISTKQDGGSYVLQFINVDRQKLASLKIELDDQRKTNTVTKKKLTGR